MKVVSSLKRRCPHCYIVRRAKKIYLKCEMNPRHKQRQGYHFSTYRPEVDLCVCPIQTLPARVSDLQAQVALMRFMLPPI